MSGRDAFDCFCLLLFQFVITITPLTPGKMQESAQAQRERYAALQRKLEQLEKIHADEKKQVRFHFSPWLSGHLTFG